MTVTGPLLAVAVGVLAAMFVASGVPKLRRPFDSALAMVRFGVLKRIRPVAGRALGGAEVLLGVALVASPSPRWPALAGVALLAVFTTLVAVALARGRSFECACFGTGERISWSTVARNVVYIAAAAGVAAASQPPADRLLGLLAGVLIVCGYLVLSTMATLRPFATTLDGNGAADG
ncbi:MauE/DoxX family redox-associated membrane protein [Micromonospora sp. 067-2]|uniref:MauE/DoxX family redox-associated membrane protein n=1 Tax=Micromonospora sp. 067-2 TaxID=2789270 RepID=UPI00397A8612